MDEALRDLRHAARLLARSPGFTAAAMLSLALGIGANTTIFTWVDAVLVDPFPGVADPQSLAALVATDTHEQGARSLSYLDYLDYRASGAVSGLIAQDELSLTLETDGRAERVWGLIVSENYFDVLGVRPALGRGFRPDEGRAAGGSPVLVISHRLWQRRFGGDPAAVGRRVAVNAQPFTIVGVAPPEFHGSVAGLSLDAWVPLAMQPALMGGDRLSHRGNRWLQAIARLAPGEELGRAQAKLDLVARRLAHEHRENDGLGVALYRFWNAPVGGAQVLGPVLKVLAGVVAAVLLIACANVANLLLARAAGRRREIAVRLSLGASRSRLIRQLLTESALLALLAGAAGILVAFWGTGLLEAFAPPTDLPIWLDPRLDTRALLFTLLVSLLTAIVFGLAPALQSTRADVASTLRSETGGASGGRGRARLRGSLVVGQVALSLLLLASAGLLLRAVERARLLDPGFNPRGVLLASVDLVANGYTPPSGRRFYGELLERLRTLPEVAAASLTRRAPLGFGGSSSSTLTVEGYSAPADQPAWAYIHNVGPDYFRTMQSAIVRGRDLGEGDAADAPRVVVVNETAARRYWSGREALGGRVTFGPGEPFTVVGVARDAKYRSLSDRPAPQMFFSVLQVYRAQVTLLVRAAGGDPTALAPAVTAQVRALDPRLPVFGVGTLEEHIQASSFQQRMAAALLSGFGSLALALAAIGLYGVLAYAVEQRTREIGIRMALGSGRADIFRLVLREGMRLSALGLAAGLVAAAAATRGLSALLLGVSPLDPATFAVVVALLAAVAVAACLVPARRAAHVDPMVALRNE